MRILRISRLVLTASFALASAALADSTVTLKDVHLCCKACVRDADAALKGLDGVTAKMDQDAGTITISSTDKAKLQKAANALAESGYFGTSDNPEIKPVAKTGAKGEKVQSMVVEGVHLCCPGCVKAVDRAIKNTPGAVAHTAKKNAESFAVTGDFNDEKFFDALRAEGLSGKVAKAAK